MILLFRVKDPRFGSDFRQKSEKTAILALFEKSDFLPKNGHFWDNFLEVAIKFCGYV